MYLIFSFVIALFGLALASARFMGISGKGVPLRQPRLRPKVKPVNVDGMFLEVTNYGEPGEFEAQLELLGGFDSVHSIGAPVNFHNCRGFWQRSQGPTTLLSRRQKDHLIIGRVEASPPELPPASVFKMGFFDEESRRYAEYGTTGWIAGVAGIDPPRLELRVTINSNPRAASAAYTNTFVVNGEDPQALRDEKPFLTLFSNVTVRHY